MMQKVLYSGRLQSNLPCTIFSHSKQQVHLWKPDLNNETRLFVGPEAAENTNTLSSPTANRITTKSTPKNKLPKNSIGKLLIYNI